MKTRLLLAIVLTTVFFLSLGTGTSLAVLQIPDDIKIVPPDPSVPPEIAAFFGKSGKWAGFLTLSTLGGTRSSASLEVVIIIERLDAKEARVVFIKEPSPGYSGIDNLIKDTAKIVSKKGKTFLYLSLPSTTDRLAEGKFWIENGKLKGERAFRGNYNSFLLECIE